MLFLLYFVFLLIITNSSEFVLDFTPTTFVVLIVVLNIFLKYTTFEVYIINIKYFFTNIFLQINSLSLFLKNFNLKYLLIFQPCTLKWKPLFKKSSYFGIYRSTRNQFLNK